MWRQVGELWTNALDNVGSVFLVLTMLSVLGVDNGSNTAWYIVQTVQLIFMREKMRAWMNPHGQNTYGFVNGATPQPLVPASGCQTRTQEVGSLACMRKARCVCVCVCVCVCMPLVVTLTCTP